MEMKFTNTEECVDEENLLLMEAFCDKFWAGLVSITYVEEDGDLEPTFKFYDSEYYTVRGIRKSLIE